MASSSPSPSPSPSPSSTEVPSVTDAVTWWGEWFLSDAPIRLIGIFLFAAIVNWVLDRLIRKIVKRAAETDSPLRRNSADDSSIRLKCPAFGTVRFRHHHPRRRQHARGHAATQKRPAHVPAADDHDRSRLRFHAVGYQFG